MTPEQLRHHLRKIADPGDAESARHFMKTGPGESGAGLEFLGIRMPTLRALVPSCVGWPLSEVVALLQSRWHDERMFALLLLVRQFERGDATERQLIVDTYLAHTPHINSWALVDASTYFILGPWLEHRDRAILTTLAHSESLWERRIAMVSTLHFIRQNDFDTTLHLAKMLRNDPEDLMHKAVGWMLKEVAKRSPDTARAFLKAHATAMPRTMLRYAIEKFPAEERAAWRAHN